MKAIGVMSGSSLDGIDIAYVSFDESDWQWRLVHGETIALPQPLRKALSTITQATPWALAELDTQYSQYLADSLMKVIQKNQLKADVIGIHGHTILHSPKWKTSWQLVNGGMVSALTGKPVVCDFRNQDMALGGQGTPMAVIADRDLFPGYNHYVNLGGIANISSCINNRWTAYDLCPCNQLLNHFSLLLGKPYDKNGMLARGGQADDALLVNLLSDDYLSSPPPKSIDNTWIRDKVIPSIEGYNLSTVDVLCTLVAYLSEVIVSNIKPSSGKILFTGGGAYNSFLMEVIQNRCKLNGIECVIPDRNIIDFKEAILIAYCATLRYLNKPNFVSSATGAASDVIGGALYTPH